jgi:hypothetical protein
LKIGRPVEVVEAASTKIRKSIGSNSNFLALCLSNTILLAFYKTNQL